MKIYEKLDTTAKISDNSEIICIGAFDGVHLAHQELFKKTRDLNKQFDIVTFDVLPKIYFNDSLKPCLLYTSPSPRDRQKSRMPSSA